MAAPRGTGLASSSERIGTAGLKPDGPLLLGEGETAAAKPPAPGIPG